MEFKRTYCRYNEHIVCEKADKCANCGWNPDAEAGRREKSRARALGTIYARMPKPKKKWRWTYEEVQV